MVKKGDTLIEVLLAVGIFSMIAISVVAVMSGGTSSAQTALETTLAREEIDAQAEALRYIHDSYINDKNSGNTELPTIALWRKIVNPSNVYFFTDENEDEIENILQYTPERCPTSASELPEGAFILDTRALNLPGAAAYKSLKGSDDSVFAPAATFPRLVFSNENSLVTNDTSSLLTSAEGIYVIAVADKDTTTVLDIDGQPVVAGSPAFFDFYIRTCWYGTDAETPSTISTVIRLHNPDVQTKYYSYSHTIYDENGNIIGQDGSKYKPVNLENKGQQINRPGWEFLGYCEELLDYTKDNPKCTTTIHDPGKFYNTSEDKNRYDFYPAWRQIQYTINYDLNGGSWNAGSAPTSQKCLVPWDTSSPPRADNKKVCSVIMPQKEEDFTRSGYEFLGWCDGQVNTSNGTCSGKSYSAGQEHTITAPNDFSNNNPTINLKAIWGQRNELITITLTWNTVVDYDSYIAGTNSSGKRFVASYSKKAPQETVDGVTRDLAVLNHDCTGYCKDETFTINTLGGKDYYYYVRNYTSDSAVTGATVTVSGPRLGKYTFSSDSATGSGRIWNVFAYKNGKLVTRQKRSGGTYETFYTPTGVYDYGAYVSNDISY